MRRILRIVTLFIGLFTTTTLVGQLYNFTNYGLEQGLPQSTVFAVLEDMQGYLWVGTESGIARFNGVQFTVFDRNSGLPGNVVRSIIETPAGEIWVATDKGIGIFDGQKWRQITIEDGLQGSAITKLALDLQGRVWAGTNDAGINIISKLNDSINIVNLNSNNGLSADFVLDIVHDKLGQTWIGMLGGVNVVVFVDTIPKIVNIEDSVTLPSNLISCIEQDCDGNMWFGTLDAGAFRLVKQVEGYKIDFFNNSKGIGDPRIWDIYCDENRRVWFGSNDHGVYCLENGILKNITNKSGLPGNLILSIYRDRNRNLWMGSMNGLSLFQGFELVHYTQDDGLPGTQVLAVKSNSDNSLWVGGDGEGLARIKFEHDKLNSQFFNSKSGYESKQIISLDFDSEGTVLAGTRGDGLAVYKNNRFRYIKAAEGLSDDNINCVFWSSLGSIYVGTDLGYNEIKNNRIYTIGEDDGLIHPEVQTIIADHEGNVWMGTMGGLAKFHPLSGNYRDFNEVEGLSDIRVHALAVDKQNQIYIGTTSGIFRYNAVSDTIMPLFGADVYAKTINSLLFYNDTTLMAGTSIGFKKILFDNNLEQPLKIKTYDKSNGFKFIETNMNAICKDDQRQVWFGTVNGLTRYNPDFEDTVQSIPVVHITNIRLSFENVNWSTEGFEIAGWSHIPNNLELSHSRNHITFDFDGIYLKNPEKVRFRHKLEPYDKAWSPSISGNSVTYPGLNDGEYTFMVSASIDGETWSEPTIYRFVIWPPFWKTWWFFISSILVLIVLMILFIRYREQKLMREKEHLELVVEERTAEIVAQKDQIQKQHELVTAQKHEITASITYARRIQQAILPGSDILTESTADSFILYKPRDIVSGDFYWIGRNENRLFVAAADCTGHGVPGAFMSMLGISFMNKIVREQKNEQPEVILGQMRDNVITSLKQGNYEGSTKDGMDMSLCVVDLDTLEMTFSGAYNPAIVISENEAIELKANRMPVGLHIKMEDFTPEIYQLKKGDCVYLFSDGYQDQIGGPTGRKYMKKNMREFLLSIHNKPFAEQKELLDNNIENWKQGGSRTEEQVDDILVMGFMV